MPGKGRKPVPLLGGLAFCRGGGVQLTPKVNGVNGKKRAGGCGNRNSPAQKTLSMTIHALPPDSGVRYADLRDTLRPGQVA